MGNVIAILDNDIEVAHYEYDAWGNCTITKDINGIGTLNPIRWKSQYYDQESDLYYISGRYYSSYIKQYISASSIQNVVGNIGIVYGLNMYSLTIANPINMMYNGFNINTAIPLTWDPDPTEKNIIFLISMGMFGRTKIGRFIGGLTIAILGEIFMIFLIFFGGLLSGSLYIIGFSITMYGLFMMASSWDSQIESDMDRIDWNPFNTNADMSKVKKLSFYKGQTVIIQDFAESSFSLGVMFLEKGQKGDPDTVKHEWGHFAQLLIMDGLLPYLIFVGAPSYCYNKKGDYNNFSGSVSDRMYYSKIWEREADGLGGVNRNNNYDPFWSWSNFIPW